MALPSFSQPDKTIDVFSKIILLVLVLFYNLLEFLNTHLLLLNRDLIFYELHHFFIPQLVVKLHEVLSILI